jgi:predicted nucleic acid-binding protein
VDYLVDTNILLRTIQPEHPMCAPATQAIEEILSSGQSIAILPQNVREFWNVCTRPLERNGLGLTHARTDSEIQKLEANLNLIEDGLLVYREWRKIVLAYSVTGVQVHDAYLVAAMRVHEIPYILTFNTGDFARYADLGVTAVLSDTL